ncbi:MAG: hypothetical protein FJW30_03265 [Acidobacteria bacterium]|nr:hypothetical protein [Acidobacteriota bacterium]
MKFRALWRSLRRDPIDRELEEHFELLRQERLEAGDTPEQAARHARWKLGPAPAIGQEVRGQSLRHRGESAARYARFALRSYGRHGGAYMLATAILSLGIGLSVALFSVVEAVVLAPLPYPAQDRIHMI